MNGKISKDQDENFAKLANRSMAVSSTFPVMITANIFANVSFVFTTFAKKWLSAVTIESN